MDSQQTAAYQLPKYNLNLSDKDTPLCIEQIRTEFNLAFYKDDFYHCKALIAFVNEQLGKGLIFADEQCRQRVNEQCLEIVSFFSSQEYRCIVEDSALFDYFFVETQDHKKEWIDYYDEPTRKVKYKYEDGLSLVSCLCEAVVDAPLLHVLSLFAEIDLFKDWFPNVTSANEVKVITPYRGLYRCTQSMPWPMWHRDMIFTATGMFDYQNAACLTCIKSIPEGDTYFGVDSPATEDGHVRIEISRGYHYFQRIDDNKTKYITIFNCDPKLTYMPNWFMNHMMTKVCYQMLVNIQEKAKEVPNSEFGKRIKDKRAFYGLIEDQLKDIVKEYEKKRAQMEEM